MRPNSLASTGDINLSLSMAFSEIQTNKMIPLAKLKQWFNILGKYAKIPATKILFLNITGVMQLNY